MEFQTAVEWLIENLYKQEPKYINGKLDINLYKEQKKQIFIKAQEMEFDQVKNAYLLGVKMAKEFDENCPECEGEGCAECEIIE